MRNMQKTILKNITAAALLFSLAFIFTVSVNADDKLPEGTQKIITSVEGNLTYFVKKGDKVKMGEPLFFIQTNDWPVGRIKQIKEDIVYYKKTFERNKRLATTRAVAIQELDDSWQNYRHAINDLAIARQQCLNGFYTAPYDCEIVKTCNLPEGSGIADGEPVVFINKISIPDKK
jgi:multidrug resistance efflux pump